MGFKYVVHDTSTLSTDLMNNSAYEGTIAGNISKASILGIVCPMLKSKETVNVLRRFSGTNCQILLEKILTSCNCCTHFPKKNMNEKKSKFQFNF